MKIFLDILAGMLFMIWVIGFFVMHCNPLIHILLCIAIISILLNIASEWNKEEIDESDQQKR